jgi:DNA-directed RNA polymerase specialized sigma24 family protein
VPLPDIDVAVGDPTVDATAEAELLERLDSALRLLPAPERRAVLTAHAEDGGVAGVAAALDLSDEDADALTRNAVQLLRGALSDLEPAAAADYATLRRRSRAHPPAE